MGFDTLVFADAHVRDRRGDEQFALTQILKAAVRHKVKKVIGLGDLADKQTNRAAVMKTLYDFVQGLQDADIAFFFIEGQHELDIPAWLSCHPWAQHLHKGETTIGPYLAYGLNFQPIFKLQDELAEVPASCDMLLCHQVWGDWMGDIANPQGDFAHVPGHIRVLISGDLHQTKIEHATNADGEDMLVISPGATCAQKISEPHEHFYILVDDAGKFHKKPLQSRVFIDWPLMLTLEDVDAFVEKVDAELSTAEQTAAARDYPPEMCKPYLRFTFKHSLENVVHRVEQAVGDRAILSSKELPPEEKAVAGKAAKLAKGVAVTPLSVLDQELDKEAEPQAYELVSRMLSTNNPTEEFAKWRQEQLSAPS